MNNLTKISVTSSPENALKKLNKAKIPVYNCRKRNSSFIFYVQNKYVKKAFAIFSNPCYNIIVEEYGVKIKLFNFVKNRLGFIIGAALFICSCVLSNFFVLKIRVQGNGNYLYPQIKKIIYANGVGEFSYLPKVNEPVLISQILALPKVTFCSVEKSGAILTVYVNVEEEIARFPNQNNLTASESGTLIALVTLSGTPLKTVGEHVERGEDLIGAYLKSEEKQTKCIAAGYAKIECQNSVNYTALEQSETNEKYAAAIPLLYAEEIIEKSVSVQSCKEGVIYTVNFKYVKTVSINLNEE
ncbi:MAG: sporulation protein YqfD [Clostridia bacterium]|nr:sporulation protein YqfD [Clostridia bacterium]